MNLNCFKITLKHSPLKYQNIPYQCPILFSQEGIPELGSGSVFICYEALMKFTKWPGSGVAWYIHQLGMITNHWTNEKCVLGPVTNLRLGIIPFITELI